MTQLSQVDQIIFIYAPYTKSVITKLRSFTVLCLLNGCQLLYVKVHSKIEAAKKMPSLTCIEFIATFLS